jgi:hypothetical protein
VAVIDDKRLKAILRYGPRWHAGHWLNLATGGN